jgi:two-component system, cell cycle sensor histidine kinase and response regulator CckA
VWNKRANQHRSQVNKSTAQQEAERLQSLRDYDIVDTAPELSFDEITKLAAQLCDAPIAMVSFVDEQRQWFKSRVGIDISQSPRDISFCAHAILDTKDVFEITDALQDARFSNNPLVAGEPHIRFYAGAPLVTRGGHALGTLCVLDYKPRELTPDQVQALKVLSNQVLALLELRRLEQRNTTAHYKAMERFKQAEQMYRTLIEQVPAVAYIAEGGPNGKWHYISPRIESVLGFRAQEWMQNPMLWHERIHPDDRDRAVTGEVENWTHGLGDEPLKSQYRMIARDGSVVWISDEAVLVRDESGNPLYYRGVLVDITDIKEAESSRLALEEQLRQSQKMDAIGRLAGGIAHDFNNLLSVILNYARFAIEDLDDGDPRRQDVAEIIRAGERAATLVHQLLTFSRKEIVAPTVLNLNAIVADMEKLLRRTIGEHIALDTRLAPDLWKTKMDRGQLEQVLANLAVNARDAMAHGGTVAIRTANVSIRETEERRIGIPAGRYVCLEVEDTGTGMDDDVAAQAFEPFFTTKARGEGTGLGLATVYGIVQGAGGHVNLRSTVGKGTVFSIYLPVTEEAPRPQRQRGGDESRAGEGETVLVVEDEDGVRQVVERLLVKSGYNVLVAGSGPEALALAEARKEPIDLLLTDIVMPRMSGKELADRLSAARPTIKTVYMSGYTDDVVSRTRALDNGEAVVQKPFTGEELTARVRAALQRE